VVYECNDRCGCGPGYKNRNVQHGRKVPLEIFKTSDKRGFGLRCLEDLREGQFIDTYLGEIIADAEAKRREKLSGPVRCGPLLLLPCRFSLTSSSDFDGKFGVVDDA